MKRTLLSLAAALLCLPLLSEETEATGNHAELLIVPRLEYNPYFAKGEAAQHTLGGSALYTFFDGNITENLSFSISNHWLSTTPGDLYRNSFRSDCSNWVDWINLTYSNSGFAVTVGKQPTKVAAFEYDPYDVDVDFPFASSWWNNYPGYQWGADFSYTLKNSANTFGAQILTSPYGEKPFASGLYTFGAYWRGEFGPYSAIAQYTAIQQGGGKYDHILSLGQKVDFDDFAFELSYITPFNDNCLFTPKNALHGMFTYRPSDALEVELKGSWESGNSLMYALDESGLVGSKLGAAVKVHPLKNNRDLMTVNLAGGYLFPTKTSAFIAGVIFHIPVHIY